MKKYKWDVFEIRKNINTLQNLLHNPSYHFFKDDILETIEQYFDMLKTMYGNYQEEFGFDDNIEISECAEEYSHYLEKSSMPLLNLVLSTFNLVKDYNTNKNNDYLVTFNNNYIMEITNDFLKATLPNKYLKVYENYINNNPNYLHITSNPFCTGGSTYIDEILSKKYIILNRKNDIWDIVTPSHEIFHFIFNDYSSYMTNNNLMKYLREIEGIFANFLFANWFKNRYFDEAITMEKEELFFYQMRVLCLKYFEIYLNSIDKKNVFHEDMFNTQCEKLDYQFMIDIDIVKEEWNQESADDNLMYSFSYLAALDLFNIYEKDHDYGFYLLSKIKSVKNNMDPVNLLREKGFTFMDDNFSNLKKHVIKLEKTRI